MENQIKSFQEILMMVKNACSNAFYKGSSNHVQTIIECATKMYIAQFNGVDDKQRKAKWETTSESKPGKLTEYTHKCTGCNYFYKTISRIGFDHCPKCGAKMRGGD